MYEETVKCPVCLGKRVLRCDEWERGVQHLRTTLCPVCKGDGELGDPTLIRYYEMARGEKLFQPDSRR